MAIITVNRNNYSGLIKTLKSIFSLNNNKLQHFIIDGNSSDLQETFFDLQKNYIFEYISENDSGIYHAMNKGVGLSNSEYLLFLNSGDAFNVTFKIEDLFNFIGKFDLVYGDILDLGHIIANEVRYPEVLSFEYMLCGGLPHQATAIRKSLFTKVGLYNENYKIISDWVFFMEALFIHNVSYKHVPIVITDFEGGGVSSLSANTKLIVKEQIDYILKRFPKSLFYYYSNSPYVIKYLRSKPRLIRWIFRYILIYFNKVI